MERKKIYILRFLLRINLNLLLINITLHQLKASVLIILVFILIKIILICRYFFALIKKDQQLIKKMLIAYQISHFIVQPY